MLLALEGRFARFEGSMGDAKETLEVVEGRTDELNLMKEQLKDYVMEAISANRDVMKEVLDVVKGD